MELWLAGMKANSSWDKFILGIGFTFSNPGGGPIFY
jgi:hypothetical protein